MTNQLNQALTQPFLDLSKCYSYHQHGDVTVYMGWIYRGFNEGFEQAMILTPSFRRSFKPCIIPQSSLWKYADAQYLVKEAVNIAGLLGFDDLSHGVKIGELIVSYLPDLKDIPPREQMDKFVGAYGVLTDENGKEQEIAIDDHV